MSIKIVEKNDGLICVKWTTEFPEITKRERKTEDFQLNRYRYLNCVSNFNISLAYKNDYYSPATNKNLNLHLKQLEDSNNGSTSSKEKETDVEKYYREPYTVWMTCGENKKATKFFFKKPSAESAWISAEFSVTPLPKQLTFQIWIQFNTFGLGEMNVLVNQLTDMFLEQTNCDVQFHLPRDQIIGGHIFILSARSDVFAFMFKTDMQEANIGKVVIKDIQPEIFKELLHFIYSGRTKESLTEETAQSLIIAADKYDIKSLKKEGVRYLFTQIREDNAIELLIWGHLHLVEKLKDAALNFVAENFKTIFETDKWQELTEKYPELCLLTTRRLVKLPIEVTPKKKCLV
jgi:speckle-type POZ protein